MRITLHRFSFSRLLILVVCLFGTHIEARGDNNISGGTNDASSSNSYSDDGEAGKGKLAMFILIGAVGTCILMCCLVIYMKNRKSKIRKLAMKENEKDLETPSVLYKRKAENTSFSLKKKKKQQQSEGSDFIKDDEETNYIEKRNYITIASGKSSELFVESKPSNIQLAPQYVYYSQSCKEFCRQTEPN